MSELAAAWAAFHAAAQRRRRIADLFVEEPGRLAALSLEAAGLYLDLSKQPWSQEGLATALDLARAAGVEAARERLFAGELVNASERRAALHMALRAPAGAQFQADGVAISGEVEATRAAVFAFAEAVRNGTRLSATGRRFDAVVNIGIGGSDLGPRLAWEALKPLATHMQVRFVANVDPNDITAALAGLNPLRTLVVAASKTFTTQETLTNAETARAWLRAAMGEAGDAHLCAVTAAPERARAFGVAPDQIFGFRDWVGGRYSVWSAVSLAAVIGLGPEAFQAFLAGAAAMDAHFRAAPLAANAPVLLALAHVFNRNGLGRPVRAVIPYAQRLRHFPAYLQQLEMESNGKRVGATGQALAEATAAAVFGEAGTNGQHAFFQLLHQGVDVIPADIIAVRQPSEGDPAAQTKLLANAVAQAEALMTGRPETEVRAELAAQSLAPGALDALAPQRTFPGDRPSSFLVLGRLDPESLGALIALYEHKTFVESVLWGINPFDQWGVELGKTLAARVLAEWSGGAVGLHDPSTAELMRRLGPG